MQIKIYMNYIFIKYCVLIVTAVLLTCSMNPENFHKTSVIKFYWIPVWQLIKSNIYQKNYYQFI